MDATIQLERRAQRTHPLPAPDAVIRTLLAKAEGSQPERLADSSRWSERSADHRIPIANTSTPGKGVRKTVAPLQGAGHVSLPLRWSSLRCDLRLLSPSPSG